MAPLPWLKWRLKADGSVNFHGPRGVHDLAQATRLLVADRQLCAAWMKLLREWYIVCCVTMIHITSL